VRSSPAWLHDKLLTTPEANKSHSASENASSDAAAGNDMQTVSHASALSATALAGKLPRLPYIDNKLLKTF